MIRVRRFVEFKRNLLYHSSARAISPGGRIIVIVNTYSSGGDPPFPGILSLKICVKTVFLSS